MAASVRKHCGKQGASRTVIWPKGFPSWRPVDAGVLPVILPYARAIADALLSLIAMLFLISRYGESDWDWLSRHTPA
jgi:hypothetical protein